jgi:translation initiation factor 1
MKRREDKSPAPPAGPFNNPFGKLKGSVSSLPEQPATAAPIAKQRQYPRAVVRYERKGHGGKEVTMVEKLELSLMERQNWLKEMKQQLGCGGHVEGDSLVLQGDQRPRIEEWLLNRGVKKVTVS